MAGAYESTKRGLAYAGQKAKEGADYTVKTV